MNPPADVYLAGGPCPHCTGMTREVINTGLFLLRPAHPPTCPNLHSQRKDSTVTEKNDTTRLDAAEPWTHRTIDAPCPACGAEQGAECTGADQPHEGRELRADLAFGRDRSGYVRRSFAFTVDTAGGAA